MRITTKAGTHARIKEMEDIFFSDFHKDVYGYRPRMGEWTSWVEMSAVAFNEALDRMMTMMLEDIAREEKEQAEALVEFKDELKLMMREEGCNWKRAMGLLMIQDDERDIGYWLWKKNISFAKQQEIERLYRGA
jgi:hypothetical protein